MLSKKKETFYAQQALDNIKLIVFL